VFVGVATKLLYRHNQLEVRLALEFHLLQVGVSTLVNPKGASTDLVVDLLIRQRYRCRFLCLVFGCYHPVFGVPKTTFHIFELEEPTVNPR
jgi:hypothetical protein